MGTIELIKKHEGYRDKLYTCTAGKITVGYGRNLSDNGIRRDEAELMLKNDMAECEAVLSDRIPCWLELSETRQGVLINMMYNLGWPRLSKFKNMLKALETNDYQLAAIEMLDSRWAKQVGRRATELSLIMESNKC